MFKIENFQNVFKMYLVNEIHVYLAYFQLDNDK